MSRSRVTSAAALRAGAFVLAVCALFAAASAASKFKLTEPDLLCSACYLSATTMIDELERVAKSESKTFIVGSRLHDKGWEKKAYRGSTSHVMDALDHVCDLKESFAVETAKDGVKSFVAFGRGSGSYNSLSFPDSRTKYIAQTCETLFLDYEDVLPGLLREHGEEKFPEVMCIETTKLCTPEMYERLLPPLAKLKARMAAAAAAASAAPAGDDESAAAAASTANDAAAAPTDASDATAAPVAADAGADSATVTEQATAAGTDAATAAAPEVEMRQEL